MSAAPKAIAITQTIEGVMRNDRGRLIAALIARLRDFQLAEEVLQEAVISALSHWGRTGLPHSPQGWLLRVAMRKAIDRLRSGKRDLRRVTEMTILAEDEADETEPDMIPDERLRLIFTCCHPALDQKSRVALTLRTLGGLTTPEIARAFLDTETTMGQRLSRAKAKIAAAGIPFAVPGPDLWAERLNSVLKVIYLIFNEGYSATAGVTSLRVDLCEEAIYLGRMLLHLRPGEPEALGLLSLMLTTHARRAARFGADGSFIPLQSHDRAAWDGALIAEGLTCLDHAMTARAPGPFQIQAAISALHVQAATHADTDWQQMILLYDALQRFEPSPVIRLNRAVVLAETGEVDAALQQVTALAGDLDNYQPYHAALADILMRAGHHAQAHQAYSRAIDLAGTPAEQAFLASRRAALHIQ